MVPLLLAAAEFVGEAGVVEGASVASESSLASSAEEAGQGFQDELQNLGKRIDKNVGKFTEEAGAIVQEEIMQAIKEAGAVASETLLNSIEVSPLVGSTEQFSIIVGSSSSYAEFVEEGRRPGGQPPIQAIMDWMQAKGLPEDLRAAFAIAKTIGEQGVEARHVFQTGIDRAQARLEALGQITVENTVSNKE